MVKFFREFYNPTENSLKHWIYSLKNKAQYVKHFAGTGTLLIHTDKNMLNTYRVVLTLNIDL